LPNLILGILGSSGAVAGGSYESIATVTPYTTTSTVVFNSIPSTYKHLQLRCHGYQSSAADYLLTLNSNAGVRGHNLTGNGSSAAAASDTGAAGGQYINNNSLANFPVVMIVDILDYTSTSKNKTVRTFGGVSSNATGTADRVWLISSLFNLTDAVNSITLNTGNLTTGAHFALYGIKD
jgi:hypothetical protein